MVKIVFTKKGRLRKFPREITAPPYDDLCQCIVHIGSGILEIISNAVPGHAKTMTARFRRWPLQTISDFRSRVQNQRPAWSIRCIVTLATGDGSTLQKKESRELLLFCVYVVF